MRSFYSRLRLLLFLVVWLCAGRAVLGQAPTWQDAVCPGTGYGNSTAVDAAGNSYVAGSFTGTVTFGTTTLTSAGDYDVFVAQRSPAGAWRWAVRVGGQSIDSAIDLALDRSGNVLVTGLFASSSLAFGATTLFNAGSTDTDLFVAKLSPLGAWQWATSVGGNGYDVGTGLAVDTAGNSYVTGSFTSTATFGASTLTSAGAQDVFVAQLSPAGIWQWATRAGGSNDELGSGVAVDSSGHVVVTGSFRSSTIAFGATTLANAGLQDAFVAKLTPAGTWQWATGVGGTENDKGNSVAVDRSGQVVVTGSFASSPLAFGATTLTSAGGDDVFVAALSPAGTWQWAAGVGGSNHDYGTDVAVDGSGHVVVTGAFSSQRLAFGTTILTNASISRDAFVAKRSPAGVWQWATGAGGLYGEAASSVAVDGSGHVVVTGFFESSPLAFGATTLTNPDQTGGGAIFLARLSAANGLPEDPSQTLFTLAPNPARTTVQLTGTSGAPATLLDGLGRVVRAAVLNAAGAATLEVRGLPAGLYLVRVGGSRARRLVVE